MILVDIQVPKLNRTYDYELDEEMKAGELLTKITQIVTEKEKLKNCSDEEMLLYDLNREKVLSEFYSLKQQGVKSGDRLYLI